MRANSLILGAAVLAAITAPVLAANKGPSHSLTATERAYIKTHLREYLEEKKLHAGRGPAPEDVVAAPPEFGPLEGVTFAYTQFPELVTALATETSKDAKAFVAVGSDSDGDSAKAALTAAGANMANVTIDKIDVDSIWMRDYGPNIVANKKGERFVVDLQYNRPRPRDDAYPKGFAAARSLPIYSPSLILPGGNLILDGHGVAIMTNMVFDGSEGCDPNLSEAVLGQYFKDYFGTSKVILLKAMKNDGTGHADMFSKLLNDEIFIVGEYAKAEDGSEDNKQTLDDNAAKLANETNGAGKKFRVIRMPMPPFDNGVSRTYTNSLTVNDKVFVPQYGIDMDAKALEIYRTALPGAKVIGFDCSQIISENGAIHCITHEFNAAPQRAPIALNGLNLGL